MPETESKKPIVDMSFLKGFGVGYFLNTVLNKHAVIGALVGLLAGISMEQQHPEYWPKVSDKTGEIVKHVEKIWNWDESDEDS